MWRTLKYNFLVLVILYSVIAVIFLIAKGYSITRDTSSWIDRAQVAADREDMLEYVGQLKKNMEKYGMTSGHTALIFKTPRNNMALHYKTVGRYIERLEGIKDLPKNETAYQVALADLRGSIRELPNPAFGWLWVCYFWWLLLIGIFVWVSCISFWVYCYCHKNS